MNPSIDLKITNIEDSLIVNTTLILYVLVVELCQICLIAAQINIIVMGSCTPGQCFKEKDKKEGISKQPPLLKKSLMKGLVNTLSTQSIFKNLQRGDLVADSLFQNLYERQIIKQDTSIRMIFRGSDHKFSAEQFHQICNGSKNTILIVMSANKRIFGAFTPCQWKKGEIYCYQRDDKNVSFIFRVYNEKIQLYPLQEQLQEYSIMNDEDCGPIFGKGHDLILNDRCDIRLNWSNLGSSYFCEFKLGSTKANELLSGQQKFKIKEYQIWELRSSI